MGNVGALWLVATGESPLGGVQLGSPPLPRFSLPAPLLLGGGCLLEAVQFDSVYQVPGVLGS